MLTDPDVRGRLHTRAEVNRYGSGSQVSQAVALWLGIPPTPDVEAKALAALADDVIVSGMTGGFIAVRYVFEALARVNRTDAALRCLLRTDYPGYVPPRSI